MNNKLIPILIAGTATLTSCGLTESIIGAPAEPHHTVVVLEVGGPIDSDRVGLILSSIEHAATRPGGSVEVVIADGPNADVFDSLALPGFADGELDTEAANDIARKKAYEDIESEVRNVIQAQLSEAPDLDNGRDLLGALERAEGTADAIVVAFTSGGVHRTSEADFLDEVPETVAIDLAGTELALIGTGDVPAPDGTTPARKFTRSVVDLWTRVCDSADVCEMA